ncbi:MAG TPA: endonuclease/exonuclease/phosphatase family protein [Thermomicrobiales bacterium]|nr:endonuclease/exonuclease/phosphatase family protein [Thermomicrobiales bacterium]
MLDDTTRLTVMTANLGNGLASDNQVIAALRESGADVIALQELNARQAHSILPANQDAYPHAAAFGDSYEGRGLLSRYPIATIHYVNLVPGRPDVVAQLDLGSSLLTVIIGHPRPQIIRRGRVRFAMGSLRQLVLLGSAAIASPPAILLGDFNLSPRHPGYARYLRLGLIDAFQVAGSGRGWTFPIRMKVRPPRNNPQRIRLVTTLPVKRFDYIWTTPDIAIESSSIGPDTGSDHATVLATVLVPNRG